MTTAEDRARTKRVTRPDDDFPAAADPARLVERIAELELHLRERVEENLILDAEVRALLAEQQVYEAYVREVEPERARSRELDEEHARVYAELARLQAEDAVVYTELARLRDRLAATEEELTAVRAERDAYRNRRSTAIADRAGSALQSHPRLGRWVRVVAGPRGSNQG